jgi:ribose-phosphate pyrophosphokinase
VNDSIVLGFAESFRQAQSLAVELGVGCSEITLHRFPDGEHRLSVPASLPENVLVYLSLDRPNEKLIELLLAAGAARDNGAVNVLLVAPYLCYMRQDIAFHAGEAVSQQIIGRLLADHFDGVITVDPHLHRIQRLQQAIPLQHAIALTAAELMAEFLSQRFERPLLIGPDAESRQWVESIACGREFDYSVGTKERFGDRNVCIHLPEDMPVGGRDVVIVDDMASTGRTIIAAAEAILAGKPRSLSVLVTHALFAGDAEARIRQLAINNLWSTDSIMHSTNVISLAPLLADGVRTCL